LSCSFYEDTISFNFHDPSVNGKLENLYEKPNANGFTFNHLSTHVGYARHDADVTPTSLAAKSLKMVSVFLKEETGYTDIKASIILLEIWSLDFWISVQR